MTRDLAPNTAAADAHTLELRRLIEAEIASAGGMLPFDRFMDLTLYAPGLGYYAAGANKLGADGDFVTAPEISPLFGRCLATQAAEVLKALGGGDVLEFGAGTGALAAEMLTTLARLDALPARYLILEPSPDLAGRQRDSMARRVPELAPLVHWVTEPPADLQGLIIANEVLDAMPVHRFCISPVDADPSDRERESQRAVGTGVREIIVERTGDGLRARSVAPISPGLVEAVAALGLDPDVVEEGYCSEVNLRLKPWLAMLSARLRSGMVLLIDYGYPRREFYSRDRRNGTLMCYHRHRAHPDPFANLGLQDITAHVDFTAVAEAGLGAGLELAGYTTQASFLLGCGLDRHLADAATAPDAMPALAAGAKQLLLPTAMGERFQALALTRGLDAPTQGWCGFSVRDLRGRLGCQQQS